jgi:hypothetical protein
MLVGEGRTHLAFEDLEVKFQWEALKRSLRREIPSEFGRCPEPSTLGWQIRTIPSCVLDELHSQSRVRFFLFKRRIERIHGCDITFHAWCTEA